MTPQEDQSAEDPHQDILDALGIERSGHTPWHGFDSHWPKSIYNPLNTRGVPIAPRVLWPSEEQRGLQQGGGAISQLAPQSPVAAEMARSRNMLLGAAGSALGISDAARALRGEFTPEEAQTFALGALPGLLPAGRAEKAAVTMGKLFPEATWLGASAWLHPAEYVQKLGGVKGFAENFPASYEKLKPYLTFDSPRDMINAGVATTKENLAQFLKKDPLEEAYNDIKKALGVREGFDQKDISQSAIDKALAKNPATSLADIAGAGPSMSYSQKAQIEKNYAVANKLRSGDFPHEVPFGVPPQARALGFTTPALHGTADRWGWEGPLDQLKLPEDQIGVHFGNPAQAARFNLPGDPKEYLQTTGTYGAAKFRTYPAVLQVQNPLETRDLGSWHPSDMQEALRAINEGEHYSYVGGKRQVSAEHKGLFPEEEVSKLSDIQSVRDYISSKGFDSIKYINSVEDPGHTSYILFHESPTQPGYVIGARSPFARFDPSKLHLPSLTAGGAGILAYPLLSRNGGEEQ